MSWSTDFDKLPKEGRVIVQGEGKRCPNLIDVDALRDTTKYWVAWHPAPEPFVPPPPKPKQIEGLDFGSAAKLIEAVEQRTREIVAWEQDIAAWGEGK
jgi:hypothetical protein